MEKVIKEGQTQVYADGSIDRQFGVNTTAPYLNTPPQQLIDIVGVLFNQSGKTKPDGKGKILTGGPMTDSQVLAILVGMGIQQQLAMSAINAFKGNQTEITENNNKQKNHNKMKFTIAELHENVTKSIEALKVMDSDQSRVSYSAKNALNILEQSLKAFPMRFKNEETEVISEEIENSINPMLKFSIAKQLHRDLSASDWLNPIRELRSYISGAYTDSKWSFRISEAIDRTRTQRGKIYESLSNDLEGLLSESTDSIKSKFSAIAAKHPWSMDAKSIVNEMKAEDNKATANGGGTISTILSPVLESDNGLTFHLHGKNYNFDGKSITEAEVKDARFFDVLEGLSMFKNTNGLLVTFGESNKTLEYNLSEGTITLGKTDLSNVSIIELKEALLATNFFGYRNQWKIDNVCKFFESIDLLAEMDNFTNITSNEFTSLFLTMIDLQEGLYINKVNSAMHINEMILVPSATEAVKLVKEFINYDASPILSEKLISENDEAAKIEKSRSDISDTISFLEEKKAKVKDAIAKLGETEELTEAINLLEEEISKFEKSLQETYDVVTLGGNKGDKSKTKKGEEDFEDEDEKDESSKNEKYDKVVLGGNKDDKSKTHDGEDYEDDDEKDESVTEKKSRNEYLDDGFVEATVKKPGNGLKKGQEVYVSAEDYTSLGDSDQLEVTDVKTTKTTICPKSQLEVKI